MLSCAAFFSTTDFTQPVCVSFLTILQRERERERAGVMVSGPVSVIFVITQYTFVNVQTCVGFDSG